MNVHIVADYMLSKGIKPNGELLSPLSIQKMLYFAQGWHLAIREEPLFFEEIRAWRHGPVIKDVYTRFRRYGERSIDASAMLSQPNAILSMPTRALIDEVWALQRPIAGRPYSPGRAMERRSRRSCEGCRQ